MLQLTVLSDIIIRGTVRTLYLNNRQVAQVNIL
jgi:hypothetical protein